MTDWTPERIKALRGSMTQEQFALHNHINLRTLQGWESGRPITQLAQRVLELIAEKKVKPSPQ